MRPLHWSPDNKLPPIGSEIYDSKAMVIGKISDIIGPVSLPYFKIKPTRPNLASSSFSSLVGEPLYTLPADPRGKNLGKKSSTKNKMMKDKRQYSNKSRNEKPSNTRNQTKISNPRNKSLK